LIIPPYTNGFTGSAPDIGAYDHTKPPWKAGVQNAAVVSAPSYSPTLTPGTIAVVTGSVPFDSGASWSAAGLPGGLQIGTSRGTITGTPTTMAGSPFAVTVTATDGNGTTVNHFYALSALPYSACDLNQTGSTGVTDVQRVINEALGTATASHDLNLDGLVNVTDIQIVINAALGLGCAAL
jgi:hypothetical protein